MPIKDVFDVLDESELIIHTVDCSKLLGDYRCNCDGEEKARNFIKSAIRDAVEEIVPKKQENDIIVPIEYTSITWIDNKPNRVSNPKTYNQAIREINKNLERYLKDE